MKYWLLLGLVAGAIGICAYILMSALVWAVVLPIPAFSELQNYHSTESTKLYDRTGTVLLYDTAGSMRRVKIPLTDMSPYLIAASVAIEDDQFYTHNGIRPKSIVRALLTDIRTLSLAQGGSTITQQVIKNTLLTERKSVVGKVKEWVLAIRIERQYTKDQILETYLNETPYGGTIYGVEEASQSYFNVRARELTLAQAAFLAALPKAPTYYSPWGTHTEALKARQLLVLDTMYQLQLVSEYEYQQALDEDVVFADRNVATIRAPHFVFYTLSVLEEMYGPEAVAHSGLQVVTTLDLDLQQKSEATIRAGALYNETHFNASNAALVALNPKNGDILAMVGSRNYFDSSMDGQVNVATALRQPGSAFKPIVYATAFKKGYTPDTVLYDLKTQFSTSCAPEDMTEVYPCYSPNNYDGKFRGPMTLRDALAQSVNVIGVKALYLSGMNETLTTAKSLGITTLTEPHRYGLSLVLGGAEVTLLELSGAYAAFANDGEWIPPTPLLSVTNADGKKYHMTERAMTRVLDVQVARTMNDVLSDNVARTPAFGPNSPLYFHNALVANKTGTTNDFRDAWVIGYTSSVVVGTWAGNNDNTPMEKKVAAYILAPIWHTAMNTAIERYPSSPFRKPDSALAYVAPPTGAHEILYWQRKFKDPQLAQWDYPVALWAGMQISTTTESALAQKLLELAPVATLQ